MKKEMKLIKEDAKVNELKTSVWNSYETYSDNSVKLTNTGKESKLKKDKKKLLPLEFDAAVQDLIDRGVNLNLKRNSFLKLMGASLAMVTANCYKKPLEKIIPYVNKPVEYQPGIANYYATSMVTANGVAPLLVKTIEGKPLKVEGNKNHPLFKGAISIDSIATIWDLYDPDRLRNSSKKNGNGFKKGDSNKFISEIKSLLNESSNIAILSHLKYSPSEDSVILEFLKKYKAKSYTYDSIGNQHEVLFGESKSYGKPIIPRFAFDKADLIFSLEADFLGTWINPELYTKQFSSRRNPDSNMNKLIVAETMMSLTGANADQRFAIKSGTAHIFGLGLIHLVHAKTEYSTNPILKEHLSLYPPKKVSDLCGVSEEKLHKLAETLLSFKGRSLVVGGGTSARNGQEGSLYYIASLLNALLKNEGKTILTQAPYRGESEINLSSSEDLIELIKTMKRGEIDTLIIDRTNPVFDLPASVGFEEAIKKVKNVICLSTHATETASYAKYILALNHSFESWADGYMNGIYSVAQPLMNPLFETISVGDIWLKLIESNTEDFYQYVKNNSKKYTDNWNNLLSDGFFIETPTENENEPRTGFDFNFISQFGVPSTKKSAQYALTIYSNSQIKDGSGANISFRQELPDPVTKVTWGNYIAVSPKDADKNQWKMGEVLKVVSSTGDISLPLFIQPGLPEGSIAIAMGYGHSKIGKVAKNVGKNINSLTSLKNEGYQYSGISVHISKENKKEKIATTQKHHEIPGDDKRGIISYAKLTDYQSNPKAGHTELSQAIPGSKVLPGRGLYPEVKYEGYKWGMSIDLTKCTGCSACVIACYSENNIPAVGKVEVDRGREMSWLRIDRYYHGSAQNPDVSFQPVMCQHCDNAPCENVCPVVATSHSSEGLNEMTYNRCIGTRYCSNNCPYKVRRFNWFENWEGKIQDPEQYTLNPDVTVRSRGVIEKCTFCVHRISEKRQLAKVEGRLIQDNEIQTACQDACSADAIVFGNTNDKSTLVAQMQAEERAYKLLVNLNVKPAVSYMTRVKNT